MVMSELQPIETCPKETKKMFVVIAMNKLLGGTVPYTTDPYCVWHQGGEFVRWPHGFPPTHWTPLPETLK